MGEQIMPTYTLDQYQKTWSNRVKELRHVADRSARDAAIYMRASAKSMSPAKTGKLRQGITYKKTKSGEYEVSSIAKNSYNGFPYNLWVNQNPPFRTIHPWWNDNASTVYGDGSHVNTGQPRFFHLATLRTSKMFPRLVRKNVGKMLKARM